MLGLASSEGLGRTATSGVNFMRLMLPQPRKIEKEMRAFFRWLVIRGVRPRSGRTLWPLPRIASNSACLSLSGLSLRTLLPANAEGRERCPSESVFKKRATDCISISFVSP